MPKVSVVMAGRNSTPVLLKEAIDSILKQTFQNFELIFVDDGSDEPLEQNVRNISSDERISVYRIKPSGLGAALNYGIAQSKGEYIARIDDDDLMLPERLERQVMYLDENPKVSCVGTRIYDKVGKKVFPHRKLPTSHDSIVKGLLSCRFQLAHTSVMFRRSAFNQIGGYRIAGGGQDLDLFLQLGTVGELANIGECLTCYRISASGLGTINPKKYDAYLFALKDVLRRNLYPEYVEETKSSINRLGKSSYKPFRTKLIRSLLVWRVKMFGKMAPL